MFFFRKIHKTILYSSIIFTLIGVLFSLSYSIVSFVLICPTNINCPSNPLPALLVIFLVTAFFLLIGTIFGWIVLKLYERVRVD
jgi:hypothetical protein